jgi:hypothetical protein
MAEQPPYTLPPPVLQEHSYLYAIVLELQRIRAVLEQNAAQQQQAQEVEVMLREPKPKPKRGE